MTERLSTYFVWVWKGPKCVTLVDLQTSCKISIYMYLLTSTLSLPTSPIRLRYSREWTLQSLLQGAFNYTMLGIRISSPNIAYSWQSNGQSFCCRHKICLQKLSLLLGSNHLLSPRSCKWWSTRCLFWSPRSSFRPGWTNAHALTAGVVRIALCWRSFCPTRAKRALGCKKEVQSFEV